MRGARHDSLFPSSEFQVPSFEFHVSFELGTRNLELGNAEESALPPPCRSGVIFPSEGSPLLSQIPPEVTLRP